MYVPTEPGWYWWTAPGGGSFPLFVAPCRDAPARVGVPGRLRVCQQPYLDVQDLDVSELGGEWGERIPDNDTLKARRWVCAMDPFDRGRGEAYHCRHCGHWGTAAQRMHARTLSVLHAPDCLWLRAQENQDD